MRLSLAYLLLIVLTGCVNLPNGYRSTCFTTSIQRIDSPQVGADGPFRIVRVDPPATLHVAHSPKGYYQLYLGRTKMVHTLHNPAFKQFEGHHAEILLEQIVQTSIERYPGVFSPADNAVPVCVQITEEKRKDYVELHQRSPVLQLFSLALPLPIEAQSSLFEVKVGFIGQNHDQWLSPVMLKRADYGWYSSINPLALLPFPWRSDCPRVIETDPWGLPQRTMVGGKLTLESFVDAIVEGLEGGALEKQSRSLYQLGQRTSSSAASKTSTAPLPRGCQS